LTGKLTVSHRIQTIRLSRYIFFRDMWELAKVG
jgi:hypothetical protein